MDVDFILSSSRQRTVALARSIICCSAVDQLMLSGTLVARRLNLTPSAVSKLVSRGRLETETRDIGKELPEVKYSSAGKRVRRVTYQQCRIFGNLSPTSPSSHKNYS